MGILSAVAGLSGAKKQKKIAKRQARAAAAQAAAQKEQQRIEQVRANVEVRKERQKQVREARIRRGQILSNAINAGIGVGSSSAANALGGINTQFGANQGSINVQQGFGAAIGDQQEAAADQATEINRLQGKSAAQAAKTQVFQAIGGLGDSIFNRFGPGPGSSFK